MRILERPTVVKCAYVDPESGTPCGREIKVATRGPIPHLCVEEHRGLTSKKQRTLEPRIRMPRAEVDELRRGHADAIELQRIAQTSLDEERRQHWKTKERLRDARLELGVLREQIEKLERLAGIPPDDREGYEAMGQLLTTPAVFIEVEEEESDS